MRHFISASWPVKNGFLKERPSCHQFGLVTEKLTFQAYRKSSTSLDESIDDFAPN
jgi:hypothetical protein